MWQSKARGPYVPAEGIPKRNSYITAEDFSEAQEPEVPAPSEAGVRYIVESRKCA